MSGDLDELQCLVKRILDDYPQERRWPVNIIEEVFRIIQESRFRYLPQYRHIIGPDEIHNHVVNPQIAKFVKDYTGLHTLRDGVPAQQTSLIETYSELG